MRRKMSKEEKREHIIGVKVKLETRQKFKYVCDAEGEPMSTRINYLIKEYIEKYSQEHNINWEEWKEEWNL